MTDKWFRISPMAVAAVALAVAAWSPADAQTSAPATAADLPAAEKIVAKAIAAMGGKEAFEKIKSSHMKGNMTTPMGDMTIDMYSARPNKFYVVQAMPAMGMEITAGSNGDVGWMSNPMMGGPQIIEGDALEEMRDQAQMFEMVLRMETDFEKLETVGRESFKEAECYKVKMIDKDGDTHTVYFDADTDLLAGLQTTSDESGQPMPVTVSFGDWKQFGDIKGFTTMTVEQMGMEMVMNIEEVELNKVDPSRFDLPDDVKAAMATTKPTTAPGG